MAHYDDVILPVAVRVGAESTPMTATDQVIFDSGYRAVNQRWDQHLRVLKYSTVQETADFPAFAKIHTVMNGPANSFLARDWADWNSTDGDMDDGAATDPEDQPLKNSGTGLHEGDGTTTTFDLVKLYGLASAIHERLIAKPQDIAVAIDGVLVDPADYSLDMATGRVTFDSAPDAGALPTWGGSFYVPVAFTSDEFPTTVDAFIRAAADIELREERL